VDSFHPLYTYPRPTLRSHSLASTIYRDPILSPDRYYALPVYNLLVPAHCTVANAPQPHSKEPQKHPITMSSRTKKNVGFVERRPSKSHHHRSSRDSGVGSSSASDRASLGTAPDSPFTYQQVNDQRQSLGALQEALDAANEKIRQLEATNAKFNTALAESNKENRLLKREKADLHNKLDDALDEIERKEKVIDQFAREMSPKRSEEKRSSTSSRSSREEKRSSHSREEKERKSIRRASSSHGHRSSWRGPVPLYDSHASAGTTPNPFAPRGAPLPAQTYHAPGPVAYATDQLSYAAGPTFGHPHSPVRERYNDGRYHLSPV
jgi:hypothetical protein